MTIQQFSEKYRALGHAIQTGVAFEQEKGSKDSEPKHLRTGMNILFCESAAIANLLIEKGIIKQSDYFNAVIKELEAEVARYEERIKAEHNADVKLL